MVVRVKKVTEEATDEAERSPLLCLARRVLLAGIGAVALAQDEVEAFVNKLVERGEIAEQDGRKLIREMVERRRKEAGKAEEELDRRVEELLKRLNVPSRSDIEALSAKIAALTRKVEELKQG